MPSLLSDMAGAAAVSCVAVAPVGVGMAGLGLGLAAAGVAHLQDLIYFGISKKRGAVLPQTRCRSQVGAG